METPKSAEEMLMLARLAEFNQACKNRPPVIKTRSGIEFTSRGSGRFLEAVLGRDPTKQKLANLKNETFCGIPVRYVQYVAETPDTEPELSILDSGQGYGGA